MAKPYYGRPSPTTKFTLSDGRTAVYIHREQQHFSALHNGYPLEEEFLDELRSEDVDAIVIETDEETYLFALSQYQRGDRIGHDPYPMLRVAPLDDATRPLATAEDATEDQATKWEWVAERDLEPVSD